MEEVFPKLAEPFRIGTLELKNRIVMAPINNNYPYKGFLTDLSIDFYVARARGGAGLIILEATSVDYPRSRTSLAPALDADQYIPMFRRIADGVHSYGSKVIVQLSHVGRQTRKEITGLTPVSASAVPNRSAQYPDTARALTLAEISDIITKFGEAALRAQKAGLDGVELILGHGYLANNFLTPATNFRTDEYGGLKGGIKFCTGLLKEIKKTCGVDFIVVCRLNGDDFLMVGGNTPVEAQVIVTELQKAGADAIHVSAGMRDSEHLYADHTSASPRGGWIYLAERIKKTIKIPVIGVKRLNPELAEAALRDGKVDLVAFGKPFIADPDLANKILTGRTEEIIPCTSCCQGCYDVLWTFKPITCMLNPKVGRMKIPRGKSPPVQKNVTIVGGGPAGCEAALAAAEKGHRVTLFEENLSLGGNYRYCTYLPNKSEMNRIFPYFSQALRKNKVKVNTGAKFSSEMIEGCEPDVLILATGASFRMPNIIGVNLPHVMSPVEAITGSKELGKYVVIWTCGDHCAWTCKKTSAPIQDDIVGLKTSESHACSAGHAAVDTAETLASKGMNVTVITGRNALVPGMGLTNRGNLLKRFYQANIRISSDVKIKEIRPEGILCEKEGIEFLYYADSVVISLGMKSRHFETKGLRVKEIYSVGDCLKIGNAFTAIQNAYDLIERIL